MIWTEPGARRQNTLKTSKKPRLSRRRAQPAVNTTAAQRAKNQAAIRMLEEWMADESGYDEETWPVLKEALDRDRLSSRKLFPETLE
jgi:hypothetical protein